MLETKSRRALGATGCVLFFVVRLCTNPSGYNFGCGRTCVLLKFNIQDSKAVF